MKYILTLTNEDVTIESQSDIDVTSAQLTTSSETLDVDAISDLKQEDIEILLHQVMKGDTGNSGVAVSTTQPTDPSVKVWVNPEGVDSKVHKADLDNLLIAAIENAEDAASHAYVNSAVASKQDIINNDNKLPYAYLSGTPTIPVVPTNVSSFINDAGYLTSHQDISGKQDVISDLSTIRTNATNGNTALTRMAGLTLWSGTQAQYDAIVTKDSNTLYFIQ